MTDSTNPESNRQLAIYNYKEQEIRIFIDDNGEVHFAAVDVCKVLQIVNSRHALTRLDDDEKGIHFIQTDGGSQEVATVNESGFYTLVLSSRKAEAVTFKRWVTHEVLPSIRRTGLYNLNQTTNDAGADDDDDNDERKRPYDIEDDEATIDWMQLQVDKWRKQRKQIISLERGFTNLDLRLTSLESDMVQIGSRVNTLEQRQDLLAQQIAVNTLDDLKDWIKTILTAGGIAYQADVPLDKHTIPLLTNTDIFTFCERLTPNTLKLLVSELNYYLKSLAITRVRWIVAITTDASISDLENEARRYNVRFKIARLAARQH